MKLVADINQCTIEDWGSNTGEYNARELQVEMCEELRQCANAFVTFKLIDGTEYESKVTDGKAEVPTIDEPQIVAIGLYTEDAEGDKCSKRFSPKPTRKYIDKGSYTPNGKEAPVPTPGTFAELLAKISDLELSKPSRIAYVTLLASAWEGEENLYSQIVTIDGVTKNSQVDLTPSVEQLAIFYNKDLAFVTENENGVVTVYAIGQKPQNDYTIQVTLTEVLR